MPEIEMNVACVGSRDSVFENSLQQTPSDFHNGSRVVIRPQSLGLLWEVTNVHSKIYYVFLPRKYIRSLTVFIRLVTATPAYGKTDYSHTASLGPHSETFTIFYFGYLPDLQACMHRESGAPNLDSQFNTVSSTQCRRGD